jgi:antitoxin component YwqK of YwqJK toxin-antitoxin module
MGMNEIIMETKETDNVTWKKTHHENGNLKLETPYLDGKKHGIERTYDEHGNLRYEDSFANGKRNGFSYSYDKNGLVCAKVYFKNGKAVDITKNR